MKKTDCQMHEALVTYLYDEASPDEARAVEAHLAQCDDCRSELAAFRQVRGMLQQWEISEQPAIGNVATAPARRSAFDALKELFALAPWWSKLAGGLAAAFLVLAVFGTEINVGREGVQLRFDLLRQKVPAADANNLAAEQMRDEIRTAVHAMIFESQQAQKAEVAAQLANFESQLRNLQASDLARLAASVQETRTRVRSLERDIERRENIDLTDILFSELTSEPVPLRGRSADGD